MKFRDGADDPIEPGIIEDVIYKNITIYQAEQWPIWIGPAQQAISSNPCNPSPCSLCWPSFPHFGGEKCEPIKAVYRNITLDDVRLTEVKTSPGVILGRYVGYITSELELELSQQLILTWRDFAHRSLVRMRKCRTSPSTTWWFPTAGKALVSIALNPSPV